MDWAWFGELCAVIFFLLSEGCRPPTGSRSAEHLRWCCFFTSQSKQLALLLSSSLNWSTAKLLVGPEFCGQLPSWPAGCHPAHQSQWNPVLTAAWSASPPEAGRIYLSFFLQIHPPLVLTVQPAL
uniref:Secreted protein n=1 Tax=Phasianus colchicus TaxID=9054 RepID=A0A669PXU8_PHACC